MHKFDPVILESVDSTNNYLKRNKNLLEKNYLSVRALSQTEGRGRNDREWNCQSGQDLACTTVFNRDLDPTALQTVSVYVGLAVLRTLKEYIKDDVLCLKWPNDVFCKGKKICGILCELVKNNDDKYSVIIGTGINVNSNRKGDGFVSIKDICGNENDVGLIHNCLHENLLKLLTDFQYPLSESILYEWSNNSDSIGKRVEYVDDGSVEKGTIVEINNDCSLLIENKNKKIRYLGEVVFQVS